MLVREPRIQPPNLESYSGVPLFNTKAVVQETGVPAPTLRAWERRYGILSPQRGENDYRLYSERDMATVSWLRQRVDNGMTISQAIALLHSMEPTRRRSRHVKVQVGATTLHPIVDDVPQPTTLAAPERFDFTSLGALLLRHLLQLDEDAANRTISHALAVYQVEDVCLSLFTATLTQIGDMWANGEVGSVVEHFAAAVIRAQLDSLFRSTAMNNSEPLVLVGCAPGELHELGALTVALFLRRSGLHVAYLGQNLEMDSLFATISATRPAAVVLSATLTAHIASLREVGQRLLKLDAERPAFIFGGQVFTQNPDLARDIAGECLSMDTNEAAREVRRRLSA